MSREVLRTVGRTAPVEFEPVDIDEVLERALGLMEEDLSPRRIEVTLDLDPAPLVVDGDAIELEQAFSNLLANALANAERKAIDVVTRRIDRRVMLVFGDSGCDGFATTEDVASDAGLDLSIARGIIRDHSGSVSVANRPGERVSFAIELPLADVEVCE